MSESYSGRDAFYATYVEPDTDVDALLIQMTNDDIFPRGLALTGRSGDIPAEGVYEIIEFQEDVHETIEPLGEGELIAEYVTISPSDGEERISYTSVSGELEVTLSADDRLEGTFEFTARLDSDDQEDDLPEIVITGVFEANRSDVTLQ